MTRWIFICALGLLASGCALSTKSQLDAEVRRLCALDGGVKVYERVMLPKDQFNQYGQINFYRPTEGENSLGPEYLFVRDINYFKRGNPEMSRTHYRVIRRVDGKVLGETTLYGRGGGDLPGPWRDSAFVCPPYSDADGNALLAKMFFPAP